MRADADDQPVVAAPVHRAGDIEPARREAARVLADLLAVEPDGGAELRLVHDQRGVLPADRRAKRPFIPKKIPLLPRASETLARPRQQAVALHREHILVRLILVHVRKRRPRLVRQPRHRDLM